MGCLIIVRNDSEVQDFRDYFRPALISQEYDIIIYHDSELCKNCKKVIGKLNDYDYGSAYVNVIDKIIQVHYPRGHKTNYDRFINGSESNPPWHLYLKVHDGLVEKDIAYVKSKYPDWKIEKLPILP